MPRIDIYSRNFMILGLKLYKCVHTVKENIFGPQFNTQTISVVAKV